MVGIKKGTKCYSIFHMKCPRCHEGDFFVSRPYDLSKAGDIHKNCAVCGLKYAKEPGFYYGAMYVSYGLGVALFVAMWVLSLLLLPPLTIFWQLFIIITPTVVLSPYLYALSKIIWANMFIRYEGSADTQHTH